MNVLLIRCLHLFAMVIVFSSLVGLAVCLFRSRKTGQAAAVANCLRRLRLFVWPLLTACLILLPVSGWWLVHLNQWPLQQTWLLAGSSLFLFGCMCWLLMWGRLTAINGLLSLDPQGDAELRREWLKKLDRRLIQSLCYMVLGLLCFGAVTILMFSKPL